MPSASSRSLRSDFETFYKERDREKKALYRHVFTLGGQLALFGGLLASIMLGFVMAIPPKVFYSVVSPAIFLAMVGVVMITSVPIDELDLDSWLDSNPLLKRGGGILLSFSLVSLGVLVTLSVFPYFLGPIIVLYGVWVGVHHFPSLQRGAKGAVAPEDGVPSPPPVGADYPPPASSLFTLLTETPPPSSILWCHLFSPHYLTTGISGTFCMGALVTLNLLAIAGSVQLTPPPFPLSLIPSLFAFQPEGVYSLFKLAVACGIMACFVALLIVRFWLIARRARLNRQQQQEGVGELEKGWRTKFLYSNITFLCVTAALTTFEIKLTEFLRAGLESTDFAFCAVMVVLLLVGGLWSPLGGGRWAFNLTARAFELDLKRLRSDGAHLASLVSSSGAINDVSQVHWVKRHTVQSVMGGGSRSSKDYINRDFWILGHIVESSTTSVLLRVSFHEDTNKDWGARYQDDKLVLFSHLNTTTNTTTTTGAGAFHHGEEDSGVAPASAFFSHHLGGLGTTTGTGSAFGGASSPSRTTGSGGGGTTTNSSSSINSSSINSSSSNRGVDPGQFFSWCAANFPAPEDHPPGQQQQGEGGDPPPGVQSMDVRGGVVLIRVGISVMNMGEEAMLAWSMEHLRRFPWPQHHFPRDLLLQSPRELAGEEQQRSTFAMSSAVGPGQRLDYFLSHSWEDPARPKLEALRAYFHSHHPHSSPSLWFDKCCINRSSPEHLQNSIASLPVSMGTCNRVLILLGPTYLHRLWCVWELTSIFTFTVKELAVGRIVVAVVGGEGGGGGSKEAILKEISHWSLDKAHCFCPNEEFRMRRLIFEIGVGRVMDTISALALCDFYEFSEDNPDGGLLSAGR